MTAALARDPRPARPSELQTPGILDAGAIAASAIHCLLLELKTWPKPGLVSHVDPGSHNDMDASTFRASAAAIAPYLHALADAGARGCRMGRLRIIGLDAEASGLLNDLYNRVEVDAERMGRLLCLFELTFADPATMRPAIAGSPVYLAMAMDADRRLRLKPQNLLLNLPLARTQ